MRSGARGLSIMEMVLALGLLAGVLFLAVNFFPQALWLTRMREHEAQAMNLACSTLRQAAGEHQPPGAFSARAVERDGVRFTYELEITQPQETLRALRVRVTWQSLTRQSQELIQYLEVHHLPSP